MKGGVALACPNQCVSVYQCLLQLLPVCANTSNDAMDYPHALFTLDTKVAVGGVIWLLAMLEYNLLYATETSNAKLHPCTSYTQQQIACD